MSKEMLFNGEVYQIGRFSVKGEDKDGNKVIKVGDWEEMKSWSVSWDSTHGMFHFIKGVVEYDGEDKKNVYDALSLIFTNMMVVTQYSGPVLFAEFHDSLLQMCKSLIDNIPAVETEEEKKEGEEYLTDTANLEELTSSIAKLESTLEEAKTMLEEAKKRAEAEAESTEEESESNEEKTEE